MKQEKFSRESVHTDGELRISVSIGQKLLDLKALLLDSWYALGNVLLLIGGDETVEIGFKSDAIQLMSRSSITLTADDNKS